MHTVLKRHDEDGRIRQAAGDSVDELRVTTLIQRIVRDLLLRPGRATGRRQGRENHLGHARQLIVVGILKAHAAIAGGCRQSGIMQDPIPL
jgi:hypothetical protein